MSLPEYSAYSFGHLVGMRVVPIVVARPEESPKSVTLRARDYVHV